MSSQQFIDKGEISSYNLWIVGLNTMILLAMKIVFWRANRIGAAKALMKGWNRKVQFDVESASPFYVRVQEGLASLVEGRAEKPDLIIKARSNNLRKIIRGDLKFEEAFLRKQFEAIGSIHDAAIFNRIVGVVLDSHKGSISIFRRFFGKFI
jgi:putative sterol carrier protein